jgi:hypothetical protein
MITMPGWPLLFPITGLPQTGQKPRLTVLPSSAVWSWNFNSPLKDTASAGTTNWDECPVPLAR